MIDVNHYNKGDLEPHWLGHDLTKIRPIRYGMYGKDIAEEWTPYTYYSLGIDKNTLLKRYGDRIHGDGSITQNLGMNLHFSPVWTPEYFRFLYNRVGADHKWFLGELQTDEELKEYLSDPDKVYITLAVDGVPLAFAIVGWDHDASTEDNQVANLCYFGVLKGFQGHGIGPRFLEDILTWILFSNFSSMWLYTTSNDGVGALKTYRNAGFEVINTSYTHEYFPIRFLREHGETFRGFETPFDKPSAPQLLVE
jgi:ribosomal protein S18 acetylase RimI-like enzyme